MSVLEKKEVISERLNEVLLKEIRAIVVDALTEAAQDIANIRGEMEPFDRRLVAVIDKCEGRVLAHAGRANPVCGMCRVADGPVEYRKYEYSLFGLMETVHGSVSGVCETPHPRDVKAAVAELKKRLVEWQPTSIRYDDAVYQLLVATIDEYEGSWLKEFAENQACDRANCHFRGDKDGNE